MVQNLFMNFGAIIRSFGLQLMLILCLYAYEECPRDLVQDRCIFIISTGRAGSTAVIGALNQIDNVFIRGENLNLFLKMESIYNLVDMLSYHTSQDFDTETLYQKLSKTRKTPWFNAFPPNTAQCAIQQFFKSLYGRGQFDKYVVGFKEIRYNSQQYVIQYGNENKKFKPDTVPMKPTEVYIDSFEKFGVRMQFLRNLCHHTKLIFNFREDLLAMTRSGFYGKKGQYNVSEMLAETREWMIKYQRDFPHESFIVKYEDMFDDTKNKTLAKELLQFLELKYDEDISFASVKLGK
eukprot:TRINITY_DN2150_c0_g1_i1.p3 TRINITY_DN2150_c0_g1~~TRINITY_DN2150_c0_g1_i1.p3  ORF type:complete len:293 (-),score=16.11 TRINITY_DN2150_c0_g1_i1:2333-3211(-)